MNILAFVLISGCVAEHESIAQIARQVRLYKVVWRILDFETHRSVSLIPFSRNRDICSLS